ncbi:MAG: Pvc16 family protein [Planctomycetota bacterium]
MIDERDVYLKTWVEGVLGKVTVSFDMVGATATGAGVSLYLLRVTPDATVMPVPRAPRARPPVRIALHYLITTWAESPLEAHRLLGELLARALEQPDFVVEAEGYPESAWLAFGIPPRPGFLLRATLQIERKVDPAKPVLYPLVIEHKPLERLYGQVLGPNETPLTGVVVEFSSGDSEGPPLEARTDADGRFHVVTLPGARGRGRGAMKIRVRHRGRPTRIQTEGEAGEGVPLIIRVMSLEE